MLTVLDALGPSPAAFVASGAMPARSNTELLGRFSMAIVRNCSNRGLDSSRLWRAAASTEVTLLLLLACGFALFLCYMIACYIICTDMVFIYMHIYILYAYDIVFSHLIVYHMVCNAHTISYHF